MVEMKRSGTTKGVNFIFVYQCVGKIDYNTVVVFVIVICNVPSRARDLLFSFSKK